MMLWKITHWLERKPVLFDRFSPRVWVVGLSRTGTYSLCESLRMLGYSKTIHNPRSLEEMRQADAAGDLGCALYYKYLSVAYPNSKFILSMRDLDDWLESMKKIYSVRPDTAPREAKEIDEFHTLLRMQFYETTIYDKEKLAAAYARHNKEVMRFFEGKEQRLLAINIFRQNPWPTLCEFLGKGPPDQEFPRTNVVPR